MSFPPYASHKESVIEELASIPSDWQEGPFKAIASCNDEVLDESFPADQLLKYVEISDVSLEEGIKAAQEISFAQAPSRARRIVRQGDVLVSTVRTYLKAIAYVDRDEPNLVASTGFAVIRARNAYPRFLGYMAQSEYFIARVIAASVGVSYPAVNASEIMRLPVAYPDLETQRKIAEFLDRETAKIDRLIDAQRKLINLLDEKKQSLISHAVTKGLNPDVPMKESGVDSLGRVPSHWRVARLKRVLLSIDQGWSPQCENFPVSSPDEWGVLKVGCVNSGQFDPEENKKLPTDMAPVQEHIIRRGDLLISRANTRELVGRAAVVPHDFDRLLLCDKLYRLRVDQEECIPDFVSLYMSTALARRQIENQATGASSSMLNISQSVIRGLVIALPTVAEQSSILSRINEGLSKLRALSDEAARAIEILRERRSALISAAVTGKIDVRGLVEAPQEQQALESA